jgi:hypothetical protein
MACRYLPRELVNVTRWSEDAEEWQLNYTSVPVGSKEECKFFRVIVPGFGKSYFDDPDAYSLYARLNDEDSLAAFSAAKSAWYQRTGIDK